MSPWPPEGEPSGKGATAATVPRPGHADLAGALKFGHADVRDALERASARHTAMHVAAGAVAKTLLAELGLAVAGRELEIGGEPSAEDWERVTDEAREARDTLGGVVEVAATGVPPGLGCYAEKDDRLDTRLAAALMAGVSMAVDQRWVLDVGYRAQYLDEASVELDLPPNGRTSKATIGAQWEHQVRVGVRFNIW